MSRPQVRFESCSLLQVMWRNWLRWTLGQGGMEWLWDGALVWRPVSGGGSATKELISRLGAAFLWEWLSFSGFDCGRGERNGTTASVKQL